MRRPLGRRAHAVADFAFAAVELALPARMTMTKRAQAFLRASGGSAAGLGAMTKHELGLVKLVPMRVHLALDAVLAGGAIAAAAALPDSRRVKRAIVSVGVAGAVVTLLTDPDRP